MNFSEWLVEELAIRGWSRSEAARRGGVSPSMFDKVINGYAKPGIKFINGISKAFSISIPDVMDAINGKFPNNKDISEIETTERSKKILENYKHSKTKVRALEYLEFLKKQEEKDDGTGDGYHENKESLKKALGG
jgi:transcriptional regulator with XRE-family HTH domain